jgi:hypothetical protein
VAARADAVIEACEHIQTWQRFYAFLLGMIGGTQEPWAKVKHERDIPSGEDENGKKSIVWP